MNYTNIVQTKYILIGLFAFVLVLVASFLTFNMKSQVLGVFTIAAGTCGDGTVDLVEQCDDSNTSDGDGCSAVCEYENHIVLFEEDKDFEVYNGGAYNEVITDPSLAKSGDKVLKIWMPDKWHIQSRLDFDDGIADILFLNVDAISFWIRTVGDGATFSGNLSLSVTYSGSYDESQNINILPYVSGGVINNTYKQVIIPSSVIAGNFGGNFRKMYFKLPADGALAPQEFYIDDLALVDTKGLSIEAVEVLDNKHVKLTVDEFVKFSSARNTANYTITGGGDSIVVDSVGISRYVSDFGSNSSSYVIKDYLYLTLSNSMKSDVNYSLSMSVEDQVGRLPLDGTDNIIFNYNNDISSSIKINQVGYLPVSPKRVYVGNWLGDDGEMTLPSSDKFVYIKNKSGDQVVYSGKLDEALETDIKNINGEDRAFSGEDVWYFDFSSFENPGSYYVQVDGVGRSYDFEIADDLFNDIFYTSARALYYQRSGTPLTSQYAGIWNRGAAQLNTAGYYHNSILDKSPALYSGEEIGGYTDLSGGWFDAADYNKYIKTAAEAVDNFLTIYGIVPENFSDNQLNIPESNDGIPDILNETKWEVDWIAKMVSSNGCVYNKVAFENWSDTMPDLDTRKHWAITKTTVDTAHAAAALAKAARVLQPFFPTEAQYYKTKALDAWQCLLDNPDQYPPASATDTQAKKEAHCNPAGSGSIPSINSGCYWGYSDDEGRAWAAIELFALTGDPIYDQAFTDIVPTDQIRSWTVTSWYYQPDNLKHFFDYYNTPGADSTRKARYIDGILAVMNVFQESEDLWPYKVAEKGVTNIGFGTISMSTRKSFVYILAHELTGDPSYLEKAKLNMDFQLGANPLSKVFMTGIGDNSVLRPHHKVSEKDGIIQPIPGFTVYGPANAIPHSGYYIPIKTYAYPAYYGDGSYPATRKYLDHEKIVKYGEFVIDDLTAIASVFGFFSSPSGVLDTTAPISYSSHSSGTYDSIISVSLTANEPATIYYCLGSGCTPNAIYVSTISIAESQTLRYYASDVSGNIGGTNERVYTINIPAPCVENWTCSDWTQCTNSSQARICTDSNSCGTTVNKPTESQGCTDSCTPDWSCTSWSTCSNSSQTRTCNDNNSCGIESGKPTQTNTCTDTPTTGGGGGDTPTTPPVTPPTTPDTPTTPDVPVDTIRRAFYKGRLIKVANDPAVYHVGSDGKKRLFVNAPTFWSWRTGTWADHLVEVVSQAEFDALDISKNITVRPGTNLVRFQGSDLVYIVKSGDILCPAAFGYGDSWEDKLVLIQNSFEADYTRDNNCALAEDNLQYPDGSLIQYKGSGNIWYLENGRKRQISDFVFKKNGFKVSDIIKEISETIEYDNDLPLERWE
jgi:cysteine-rich repeat protein